MDARRLPPALVLGAGLTALGVVRTLGRQGIPCLLAAKRGDPTARSRWLQGLLPTVDPLSDLETFVTHLSELDLERTVLLPCHDRASALVSRLPAAVAVRFPSSLPPSDVLESFIDKAAFARLLRRHGVPHPRTLPADTEADLEALGEMEYGVYFLKPRDSQRCSARFRVKAFRFADPEGLRMRWGQMLEAGCGALLQEFIPGPPTSHYFIDGFVDREQTIRALFARQRVRMHPQEFGNSTALVSVPLDTVEPITPAIARLLQEVGYRGIFSAEIKRDDRDGVIKLLEINARPWWFVEFAALCGVDVCGLAYRDALGEKLSTVSGYEVGRRYTLPSLDLLALCRQRRQRRIGFGAFVRALAQTVVGGRRLDDPMPPLARLVQLARLALARLFTAASSRSAEARRERSSSS